MITPTCVLHDMGPNSDGATEIHLPLESVNHDKYTFIFRGTFSNPSKTYCCTARLTIEDINDEWGVPAVEVTVEDVDSGSYALPVATPETLGGVQPVTKTASMTQPVGVDALGRLFTFPGSGGSSEGGESGAGLRLYEASVATEEAVNGLTLSFPVGMIKFIRLEFHLNFGKVDAPFALYSRQAEKNHKKHTTISAGDGQHIHISCLKANENIPYFTPGGTMWCGVSSNGYPCGMTGSMTADYTSITFYSATDGVDFPAGTTLSVWGVYEQ